MPGAPRTYCGILSYCLQHPGRPVDVRTLSTVIGESAQKVTQVCEALVQAGVLVKFGSDDAPRPFFQLREQEAERAQKALAAGARIL